MLIVHAYGIVVTLLGQLFPGLVLLGLFLQLLVCVVDAEVQIFWLERDGRARFSGLEILALLFVEFSLLARQLRIFWITQLRQLVLQ